MYVNFKTGDRVAVPAITPDWREKSIQEGNDRHASAHFLDISWEEHSQVFFQNVF